MPEPVVVDHILVAVMVLVDPLYGVWEYRRLVRRVRAGVANARAAAYRKAMFLSWPLTIGLVAVADLVPRTEREGAQFRLVSITAGVCEEIWCRGFLIWYLAAFVGEWPAVFLGALVFGALHVYQGPAGAMKTSVTGLLMGILYVGTGSLLFPIILHTAVDLHGGAMARRVLGPVPSAVPA